MSISWECSVNLVDSRGGTTQIQQPELPPRTAVYWSKEFRARGDFPARPQALASYVLAEPRIHRGCGRRVGVGNRREHRDFLRRERGIAEANSVSRARAAGRIHKYIATGLRSGSLPR